MNQKNFFHINNIIKNIIKKDDVLAGIVVSFIALPLCIGIAGASIGQAIPTPAISGILSAMVGGLVVSLLAGSHVTIHGPAAGLIVVVQQGILALSELTTSEPNLFLGYKRFLAAAFLAGILQITTGLLRLARYVTIFPSNVIHGMLAAIGVIIISKQVHVALGVTPVATKPLALYAEILQSLEKLNPEIAFIGLISLFILIFFRLQKKPIFAIIPAPLVVVLIASLIGAWFDLQHEHKYLFLGKEYMVNEKFLVTLPQGILSAIHFPDFSHIFHLRSLLVTFSIFMIATLESLLATIAVDKLDPLNRKANLDKEVLANGMGNSLLALLGGLPIVVEIVRSTANIKSGAKSRVSDFVHGLLLFLYVFFLPTYIHLIPNAALAAILIFVGFQLAHPRTFLHVWDRGKEQFIFFATTLFATIAVDLLVGVFLGLLAKLTFLFANGIKFRELFKLAFHLSYAQNKKIIKIESPLLFTNFMFLNNELDKAKTEAIKKLEVDLSLAKYVDHTSLTNLYDAQALLDKIGKSLEIIGLSELTSLGNHQTSARKKKKVK